MKIKIRKRSQGERRAEVGNKVQRVVGLEAKLDHEQRLFPDNTSILRNEVEASTVPAAAQEPYEQNKTNK
jgi:hypothetical protein